MNTILHNIDPNITYALGWTIIHSFWQASLIALIMSLIHKYGRNKNAAFKYKVAVVSMISVLVLSMITFIFYFSSSSNPTDIVANYEIAKIPSAEVSHGSQLGGIQAFFTNNLDHINLIWIAGVLLFVTRFLCSYLYTKYLRNTALFDNAPKLNQILSRLKSNLHINKTISIAESAKIEVPLVLGHFKPLILFPIGMINMLTTKEVEAIITHELAHIKRFDYLSNILLTLVEILFYFHPAVWWISANVKAERENCCDDFALSNNIDKVIYAKALVKLQEIKMSGIPSLAMPFSSKKHQLLNRIKRIMNMPQTQNDIREKSIATVLLLSIFLMFNTQVNSKSSSNYENLDAAAQFDTLKVEAKDEIVLTVNEGKFESLVVDEEFKKGEVIDKIAATLNSNSKDKTSYTITASGNPSMKIIDDKVNIFSGEMRYENDSKDFHRGIQADTLPDNYWESNATIINRNNGKVIEVEKKDGKVIRLKIDGKVIPPDQYENYKEEIESLNDVYRLDSDDNIFQFDDNDFSKSFGMLFDGENWREFGGNFEHLIDSNFMKKLEDMEHMRFDLRGLENLEEMEGLERLREFEGFNNLEELKHLENLFEEMGIRLDTSLNGMNFKFHNFDGLNDFEFFNDDDVNIFRSEDSGYKRGTVVDKMGQMLNKDGLLQEYKSNKIEITGKHLKINGEKMPNALFEKYKKIYQEATGAPLTKKSKMVFDVEGKPSKRKIKTF